MTETIENGTASNTTGKPDQDYVIRVVQFLQNQCNIVFFITTTDFDTMYNWYEKQIPMGIIKESIKRVIERWKKKNKTVTRLTSFNYEVKKNHRVSRELQIGNRQDFPESPQFTPEIPELNDENRFREIDGFMAGFPDDLLPLKEKLEFLCSGIKSSNIKEKECEMEAGKINSRMLDMFKDDEQLNLKTSVFLKNLSPELRKPEIENRYRVNYLLNKYKVPDFAGYF